MSIKLVAIIDSNESRHGGEHYRHVRITVVTMEREKTLATFEWQSHAGNQEAGWYAGKVMLEQRADEAVEALGALARLLRKSPLTDDPKGWWESTGLKRVVRDLRESNLVPADNVKSADWHRIAAKTGVDYNLCVCAQKDRELSAIKREFAEAAAEGGDYYMDKFAAWVQAGSQWEETYRGSEVPVVEPLESVFAPLGGVASLEAVAA